MIKKIFRAMGRPFKPFVNIPTFIGWKSLKESSGNFSAMAKDVFPGKDTENAVQQETFEEAQARFNLSEQDLLNKQKNFLNMSIFYLSIAIIIGLYMFYLLFTGVFLGVFMAVVLVFVALAYAYKEHFWYIQMRQRRLGLTFKEWRAYAFGGRGKS